MKSNVIGVLAGIATGALLGVLFAPDKGSKTRKKIKTKSLEAKDNLVEVKDNLKEEFDTFLDSVSNKYDSLVKDGEEMLEKRKDEVKKVVNSK